MFFSKLYLFFGFWCHAALSQEVYETDMNFRIDAGSRTCFFEKGIIGQVLELFYQVIDGQHGDLDISVDVFDPRGVKLISDHKKTQNSIILDLEHDGDYVFCMDNTFSVMNSKLVFMYVAIEDKAKERDRDAHVSAIDAEGKEHKEEEIVEFMGRTDDGEEYRLDVTIIIDSLTVTLNRVIKARHMLDVYSASKSRDSYLAVEDTFIVDAWSSFQILFMAVVGFIQVYMIKKLFTKQTRCERAASPYEMSAINQKQLY